MKKRLHVFLLTWYMQVFLTAAFFLVQSPIFSQCNLSVSITGKDPLCNGQNNGSVTSTATGASVNATYLWSSSSSAANGTGGIGIANAFAGTYTLTVTDGGCAATSNTITLHDPLKITSTVSSPNVGGYNVTCYGAKTGDIDLTVTGGATPYTYLWSNGATTEDLSKVAAGTYTVNILDANKCPAANNITLTQPDGALDASGLVTQITCINPKALIDLSVVGGVKEYTYLWNNGATTSTISNLDAGTYSVAITDAVGCQLGKAFTVNKPAPLAVSLSASQSTIFLTYGNQSTILHAKVNGGTQPYHYAWSPIHDPFTTDRSNVSESPKVTTDYTVKVSDSAGCTTTASIQIVVKDVSCSKNDNKVLMCVLDKKIPFTTHTECVPQGKVQKLLEDQKASLGGCPVGDAAASTFMTTISAQQNLVLADAPQQDLLTQKVKITPNPTTAKFEVLLNGFNNGKVEIKILDASGREVERRSVDINGYQTQVEFNLASKPKGLYLINIVSNEETLREKVIKR
jgi:hypothetical protein